MTKQTFGVVGLIMEDALTLEMRDAPKELSFLLSILRNRDQDQAILPQEAADMDWDLFMKLAVHHRVYPLVYLALKGSDTSLIPAYVMQSLQRHYHNNTIKMLHLSREMSRICDVFAEAGIRSLWLKGPLLALHLYGDVAHRTSKDLDILVDAEDVEKAEQVLTQLGYEAEEEIVLGNWKKKSHHRSFEHREHFAQVEIHWRLNPHYSRSFSFEQLWQRRREVRLSSQTYFCLGNEDLLCYLTDHGARHGWFRLRWLADIVRLLPLLDNSRLNQHLERYGGEMYAGQAFILSSLLLSAKVPHDLEAATVGANSYRLAEQALYYIQRIVQLNPVPEKSVARHYNRYLFSLMSGKQRIAYVFNKLLPSSRDALQLPLPKPLYFLYVPLRPFLWFWRRMKQPSV
ncbi:nucleotidyltransferase domain-containing protein [Paenibacillus lactis]|uniref:nucleotidyltransferase domain-containing protein n=1 Tax=Paenibacillus lactis TaxID=228574 RepID=UPI001BCCBC06|nr:nucleotidyltransferase family protein [Paenibacillus lactis]